MFTGGESCSDDREREPATMKRILIARDLHTLLERGKTFLNRPDMTVLTADTSDEALAIHRAERVHLIITRLELPGMDCERFCSAIRDNADLRTVSIIVVCENKPAAIERGTQCRVNEVLLQPVHPLVLMVKAQQLLDVSARETLRAVISVTIEGRSGDEDVICRSLNVSATGMLIETGQQLAVGDRFACQFHLPNAKMIEVAGKIVRTQQAPDDALRRYGLMFTEITPETRQHLIDFVGHAVSRERTIPA